MSRACTEAAQFYFHAGTQKTAEIGWCGDVFVPQSLHDAMMSDDFFFC